MHRMLQPRMSLFSLSKLIPEEFVSGELFYPIYSASTQTTTWFLASPKHAVMRVYCPYHLLDELAYFQVCASSQLEKS